MSPTVSVVIPAYNAATYLAITLRSVLAQTLPPTEIIVVDDASQDTTADVAASFANDGVRVIPSQGRGAANALNTGISRAAGELIAHFDADDLMLPEKLECQVRVLASGDASLGFVASDLRMFDESGPDEATFLQQKAAGTRIAHQPVQHPAPVRISAAEARDLLARRHCIDVKGVYRRSVWEAVGGFNPAYRCAYDMDFLWRVAGQFEMAIMPEVLFLGRRHNASLSAQADLVASECVRLFRAMLAEATPDVQALLRRRVRSERWDLAYSYRKQKKLGRAIRQYFHLLCESTQRRTPSAIASTN